MTEYRSAGEVRTGRISGNTFRHRQVRYSVVGGLAVVEGDIIVGTVQEIEAVSSHPGVKGTVPFGVGVAGSQFLWPQGRVPYRVDPALPEPGRVRKAIDHWEARTSIRFLFLDDASFEKHPDRVLFTPGGTCSAAVGRRGNEQLVVLEPECGVGHVIHEVGHVVGLWHEHSRSDRDDFIEILWENIDATALHNFDQKITDGDDVGDYDYGSAMHYQADAFSRNGQPTIRTRNGAAIGQRDGLSPGDMAAVRSLYS